MTRLARTDKASDPESNPMKMKVVLITALTAVLCGCGRQDDLRRLDKICRHLDQGRYGQLISAAEAYVKDFPKSPRGWTTLAWGYLKTDKLEKAQRCISKSMSLDAKWDNAYVAQGVLHRKRNELDKARKSYQRAISLDANNPEALTSLVVIELMEQNFDKAVEYGEKAWKLRKDYSTIPANLSVAYHFAGQPKKREIFYQHAKRLRYPNLARIRALFDEAATPNGR